MNFGRQNVRPFIGRALFNGGCIVGFDGGKRFRWSFCRRALGRAVLNEDAGAGSRSMAMKLRRECGRAAGVRGRRASVAHQSANYFFPAQGGGGARKGGAGLR